MLQRHIEERRDTLLAARVDLLRRANLRRDLSPPLSRGRPETREIETQTDKTGAFFNTRPNKSQTDHCTKSAETENAGDELNKPSTSECVVSDIGMAGPSNRNNENKRKEKPAENAANEVESLQEVASAAAATPSGHQSDEPPAVDAEPEQPAVIQPNPVAYPPNRDADGNERRQRLIIIHQRRHDEAENAPNRNR